MSLFHPRNRHQGRYDFDQLIRSCPDLSRFVRPNPHGDRSVDFADPAAVRTLNRALLAQFYGIQSWDIPEGFLCPPVPGRSDYLHWMADLLASSNQGVIPQGGHILGWDIGVGASCIYPLVGHLEYGWSFVGSDVDPVALASSQRILAGNPGLSSGIELRLQKNRSHLLQGLLKPQELVDFTLCNPPFHASAEEALEGSRRKWRNLGRPGAAGGPDGRAPVLNFGGQSGELWCPGGEAVFVGRLIEESTRNPRSVFWYSTLISKEANLPRVYGALERAGAFDCETIDMAQGQKKSRVVAWTFLDREQQADWRARRWSG